MKIASQPKPVPATIGTFFGGLWAFIAAMALPSEWHIPASLLAALVTALLIVRLWRASRTGATPSPQMFGRRAYQISVILEILAIYAASALSTHFGWQQYFIQVVGLIVGLHFIGLWTATGYRRFLGIMAGMCVVSATALTIPATIGSFGLRDAFTGLGNAIILWLGASRTA